LNEELTAFETIDKSAVGDIRTKIRDILGAFMFSGQDADKKVKVLSGGERARLAMISLLLEPVNFLVLDEPTNHLDIHSKGLLKQALMKFDGTLLVVSHDREFMDGLVNVVYEFKHKKIKQHLGGVYEFLQKRKMESLRELELSTPEKKGNKEFIKEIVSAGFEERKEINRMINRIEKQIGEAEWQISKLEEDIAAMDKMLADPSTIDNSSLFERYGTCKKQVETAMIEWELLHRELKEWEERRTW
jgi:ATP-binding cassette, subfamily F, member 3